MLAGLAAGLILQRFFIDVLTTKMMVAICAVFLFIALVVGLSMHGHYRMKKFYSEREDANICAYARSFEYRNVDTKIIRAVYNKVQEWAGNFEGNPFPVRSDDSFDDIYQMDPEDLNDICCEVADELGISAERTEENPYYGEVKSVKELVLFLHHQPKVKNVY